MTTTPSRAALEASPDEYGERTFPWDGVEFRVGEELARKLAKGRAGSRLFDEIVGGYLAAMSLVGQAIRAELASDWFDPEVLGTGAEEIAACLGPVTVHTVSRKWGTRLTYTEHRRFSATSIPTATNPPDIHGAPHRRGSPPRPGGHRGLGVHRRGGPRRLTPLRGQK